MTEKEFFDLLIERYSEVYEEDLQVDNLGYYLEYFLDKYPEENLSLQITKKVAARIIHEFMVNVLKWEDVEWGEAGKLRDIYDCRVCSNAIAQVYTRGIIGEAEPLVFGLDHVISEKEGTDIVYRFFQKA